MNIEDLDINISDCEGELKNIDEIKKELLRFHSCFSTHAMSEHALFLQGQKDMLRQIIDYLDKL